MYINIYILAYMLVIYYAISKGIMSEISIIGEASLTGKLVECIAVYESMHLFTVHCMLARNK